MALKVCRGVPTLELRVIDPVLPNPVEAEDCISEQGKSSAMEGLANSQQKATSDVRRTGAEKFQRNGKASVKIAEKKAFEKARSLAARGEKDAAKAWEAFDISRAPRKVREKNFEAGKKTDSVIAATTVADRVALKRHPNFRRKEFFLTEGNASFGFQHIQKRHLNADLKGDSSQFKNCGFQNSDQVFAKVFDVLTNGAQVGIKVDAKGQGAPIFLIERDDQVKVAVVVAVMNDGRLVTAYPLAVVGADGTSPNPYLQEEMRGYKESFG